MHLPSGPKDLRIHLSLHDLGGSNGLTHKEKQLKLWKSSPQQVKIERCLFKVAR